MRQFCFFSGRFGAYGAPRELNDRGVVVVLCSPGKQESVRVHWCWNLLMDQLCQAGFHVFKFDYWGTGDSQGTSPETTIGQAMEDLELAVQEALDMSGVNDVILLGLRLGANIAAKFADLAIGSGAGSVQVKGLCLWDPLETGSDYLKDLLALHHRMPQEAFLSLPLQKLRLEGHLLGHAVSQKELDEIRELILTDEELTKLKSKLKTSILKHSDIPSDYVSWKENLALEDLIRPSEAVKRLAQMVAAL